MTGRLYLLIRPWALRWHRWRVWRTTPGTPERQRAVAAYLRWHRAANRDTPARSYLRLMVRDIMRRR